MPRGKLLERGHQLKKYDAFEKNMMENGFGYMLYEDEPKPQPVPVNQALKTEEFGSWLKVYKKIFQSEIKWPEGSFVKLIQDCWFWTHSQPYSIVATLREKNIPDGDILTFISLARKMEPLCPYITEEAQNERKAPIVKLS